MCWLIVTSEMDFDRIPAIRGFPSALQQISDDLKAYRLDLRLGMEILGSPRQPPTPRSGSSRRKLIRETGVNNQRSVRTNRFATAR